MTTHVLMIVDMSGSMYNLAEDVRGGFNQFIDSLSEEDNCSLTVTLFDTEFISLCAATPLSKTPRLNSKNYMPRGSTALLDAVGKTVLEFESKDALKDGDRVLVVVQTDGFENASSEFKSSDIAKIIKDRESTEKWSFVFLGAGPDTWTQAGAMGFQRANTVSYDPVATRSSYEGVYRGTKSYAGGQSVQAFTTEVATASGGIVRDREEDENK